MLGPVVTDITGTVLTDADRKRIRSPLVGMVILFSRNFENVAQLEKLTSEIHDEKPGILISVDHEGGRVQRFREGFTRLPALAQYGRMYETSPGKALRAAWSHGYVLASELLACGVDFSFAPDLDLDWGHSKVIGHRSFSASPKTVTDLAYAMIDGLRAAGMASCGKHFPGHGWADADSHKELPADTRLAAEIIHQDVRPYTWLGQSLSSVMTAHVAYPDYDELPATFSHRWLQNVLREQCGFHGLVFSDDLAMGGALGLGNVVQRAEAALRAGCDALILCNDSEQTDELLAGLKWNETPEFKFRAERLTPGAHAKSFAELKASPVYRDALQRIPQTDADLIDWQE